MCDSQLKVNNYTKIGQGYNTTNNCSRYFEFERALEINE